MALAPVLVAEIGDLGTVHIIFAHCKRLQPVTEPLCTFRHGRHDVQREVQRRFTLAVEAPAGDRCSFARNG